MQGTDCGESNATCDKPSETEPTSMCKKLSTIRGNQQSCINKVTRETKTAGTLAVVVGGFVACWLPFFILYLATPFVPVQPPDVLMPALTWLGNFFFTYRYSLKHVRLFYFPYIFLDNFKVYLNLNKLYVLYFISKFCFNNFIIKTITFHIKNLFHIN